MRVLFTKTITKTVFLATAALLTLPFSSFAASNQFAGLTPNPEQGKVIAAQVCAACHMPDGNSTVDMYPKIAGQYQKYLIESLAEYRKGPQGKRNNPIMYPMVATLTDQNIVDLASYFSSQTMSPGGTDEKLLKAGERLYRGGDAETGVPACIACHGPQGLGNEPAGFPRVSGQHPQYLSDQLKLLRAGTRTGGVNNMMLDAAKHLTDDEIAAVSSYMSGLH